MEYRADRPIEKQEEDLLGRATFSNQLGKAIYKNKEKSGLVIGLFGEWGTGKTSVVNMAENEIKKLSKNDENKPLIVRFSPWNYTDKNNLISLFFKDLRIKIYNQSGNDYYKKVGEALENYSKAVDLLNYVPLVGDGVVNIIKTILNIISKKLSKKANLDESKKKLEKALKESDKKIIVVIDDIDRLTNVQIRDIFQLVKQVADFPNVTYLLVMDRKVVQGALAEIHNLKDGNEYLEKIIQIPIELPGLSKYKLDDILLNQLNKIIVNTSSEIKIDENYWSKVFTDCISPYILTLRDINRVVNTFQFRYSLLYQEVSFEDMIAISTIEVLEPKLYKWISKNKEVVCGGSIKRIIDSINSKPDYRKLYSEEFEKIGINPEKAIKFLSTMFPVFLKDINGNTYFENNNFDIRKNMRVAYGERFDVYFMCDLSDIKVPRNIINSCVYDFDKKNLLKVIDEINEKGDIVYFLEEFTSLVSEIPYKRLSLISSVLLILHGKFYGERNSIVYPVSAITLASRIIEKIIDRLETDEEKYLSLSSLIENADETSLGTISNLLIAIGRTHGRFVENIESKDERIITVEYLQKLEEIYLEKIKEITNSVSISNIVGFKDVYYLWRYIDEIGLSKYIEKLFKSEVNKLKFVSSLASKWVGSNIGWAYYSNIYENYISNEEIYISIMKLDKNMLYEFTELEQIKLASFVCNYGKDELDHASEDEARELLKQWELEARIINSNIK